MPLIKSTSRKAFVSNLKAELAAGKPKDQALAIAYSVKRRARRAEGGSVSVADLTDAAYEQLRTQPERNVLPDVGEPLVSAGPQISAGYRPANVIAEELPKAVWGGLKHTVETPGAMMSENPYPKGSEQWQFFEDQRYRGGMDWAPGMALNTIGTGAFARPVPVAPGETVLGAGAIKRGRTGVDSVPEIDHILETERALKGATHEPAATPAATAADLGPVGPGAGGQAGTRSLPEAQAAAARWAGERAPLPGIQGPLKIGEDYFVPGPIGRVHDVADAYMQTRPDINYAPPTEFRPIDPEHSKAIAQAYEEMKHKPNDPAVKASYDAMIDETKAQYDAIKASGLKIEPIPPGMPDPYAANPRLAALDVAENNHLWFFPTTEGFGTVNKISDNPLLRKMGEKIGDHELTANDMFRVVHDYFGHLKHGHGFRAAGEDNAWRTHAAMYSDLARPAMTTETRGQNSWVNFGPHGEKNRTASGADTIYADQKVGLLPDWVMYDRNQAPMMMYHGSAADHLRPDLTRIGSGQGQMAYGAGYYGSRKEGVAKKYRDMQTQSQITRNGKPASLQSAFEEMRGELIAAGATPGRSEHIADAISNLMDLGYSASKIRKAGALEGMGDEVEKALKIAAKYKFGRTPGHMYKWAVEANPEHLLDWDRAFKRQTPYVQGRTGEEMERSVATQRAALEKHIDRLIKGGDTRYTGRPGGDIMRERALFDAQRKLANLSVEGLSGKNIYTRMGLPAQTMEEGYVRSSQRLGERGVPGLQYQNVSGGADSGVRNYVIWSPENLRLLRKYGVVGLPASGVAADLMDGEVEGYAAGGHIHKAGGGAFGVFSPAEQAELDDVAPMPLAPEPDDSPVLFRTAHPLTDITERDFDRGMAIGLGATTSPVRKVADETGAALAIARRLGNRSKFVDPDTGMAIPGPGYTKEAQAINRDIAQMPKGTGPLDLSLQGQVPGVEQRALERYVPPRGISPRMQAALENKAVLRGIEKSMRAGEGVRDWYHTEPVRQAFIQTLGRARGDASFKRYMDLVAATSPRSDVPTNVRNASYYYSGVDPAKANPYPYGHVAQALHKQNVGTVTGAGGWDVMQNPKPASFAENLRGNLEPVTVDTHAFRNIGMRTGDPRFLETSVSNIYRKGHSGEEATLAGMFGELRDTPKGTIVTYRPQQLAEAGKLSMEDAKKIPSFWATKPKDNEYAAAEQLFRDVGAKVGMRPADAQAAAWAGAGDMTGLGTVGTHTFPELMNERITFTAKMRGEKPDKVLRDFIAGKKPLLARGGAVDSAMDVARTIKRAKGGKVHIGPIVGVTGGRADKVPMEVPDGSYVLTADHVSGLGQGNTLAGFEKLKKMFPGSVAAYKKLKAEGGPVKRGAIPIYAADGEFVVCPEDIIERFGELDRGHRILDEWQTSERKNLIRELGKLAPPAQD